MTAAAWLSSLAPQHSIGTMAVFMAAFVLLDFYDISLPRGDSVGVAGALGAAALVILGAADTLALAVLSHCVASLLRFRTRTRTQLVSSLGSRVSAIALSSTALSLVGPQYDPTLATIAVPALFIVSELIVSQVVSALFTRRSLWRLVRGDLNSQAPVLVAQWSTAVLMLVTYGRMGAWSLIPVVALLLLMRQSYALFLDVRQTYRTTVQVLVEAAESQDERKHGHANRTAFLARTIAVRAGLSAVEVERISYAALLHDLGELAQGDPTSDPFAPRPTSADVVQGVEFLKGVEPILRLCDGSVGDGLHPEEDLLAGMIVALANDIDVEYHPEAAAAHSGGLLRTTSSAMTPAVKARAVGAALRLGYRIPAVE
jgi:hypothetical protein